jgi:hypothetical protein
MDCKDLMIYDYVKYNGVTKIVDAVYLYSVSVHDPIEEWSISEAKTYSIDDIEPIELTEDILVKNGFQKFAESQTLFDYTDNDIHLEYWIGDGCFRYYTAEIHYVHQLQHLLRLCGIEKELVID